MYIYIYIYIYIHIYTALYTYKYIYIYINYYLYAYFWVNLSFHDYLYNHGCEEPSGKRARVESVPKLPSPAVDLLRAYLGTLQDMGGMILPAAALKLKSQQACIIQKVKLQAWLSICMNNYI